MVLTKTDLKQIFVVLLTVPFYKGSNESSISRLKRVIKLRKGTQQVFYSLHISDSFYYSSSFVFYQLPLLSRFQL